MTLLFEVEAEPGFVTRYTSGRYRITHFPSEALAWLLVDGVWLRQFVGGDCLEQAQAYCRQLEDLQAVSV